MIIAGGGRQPPRKFCGLTYVPAIGTLRADAWSSLLQLFRNPFVTKHHYIFRICDLRLCPVPCTFHPHIMRSLQFSHWILGLALPSVLHLPFAFYALFTIFTLNSRLGSAQCPAPFIRILCALYNFHTEFSAWPCPVPCILGAGNRMSLAPTLSMNDIKTNRVRT